MFTSLLSTTSRGGQMQRQVSISSPHSHTTACPGGAHYSRHWGGVSLRSVVIKVPSNPKHSRILFLKTPLLFHPSNNKQHKQKSALPAWGVPMHSGRPHPPHTHATACPMGGQGEMFPLQLQLSSKGPGLNGTGGAGATPGVLGGLVGTVKDAFQTAQLGPARVPQPEGDASTDAL